jgi:hypothetical protein
MARANEVGSAGEKAKTPGASHVQATESQELVVAGGKCGAMSQAWILAGEPSERSQFRYF